MSGPNVRPSNRPTVRRILIVSSTYIDPANRGKLRALAARGLDVTVGVPQRWLEAGLGRTFEVGWERQNGVEVFPIPVSGAGNPERLRYAGRALGALLRDKRPDLVQVEEEPGTRPALQVVRAARGLAIPTLIFTRQNVAPADGLVAAWRRGRTLRRLRGAIAGSTAAAGLVRDVVPDLPVAVVPQLGVPVPPVPAHAHHEGVAIGYVGRLVPEKGVDTLLEALAQIRGERWHLSVVGDGPDRERLERLASELRLAARVRWAGALPPDGIEQLWQDLDVLVVPSKSYGTWAEAAVHGLAVAMAHEVAVIGTDGGVTPEIIGEAGVIVPPGDASALAAALRRLGAPAVRAPLARAARARAMRLFSEDAVAERTLEFWRSVL
jgi:glycosyltransferase involved in cell wall biosynthesis